MRNTNDTPHTMGGLQPNLEITGDAQADHELLELGQVVREILRSRGTCEKETAAKRSKD